MQQIYSEIVHVIQPRAILNTLKRNQLIHPPTADEMAIAVSGNAHCNWVLVNLLFAPNFHILEIIRSPNHLMVSLEWNTISDSKGGLGLVKQYLLAERC